MKPASEPASHHCGHFEKSADEPRPAAEEAEDLMSFETEKTLNINFSSCPYYVSVSDRVWDPETVIYDETADSACEIDQRYEDAGAVYVGELTKKQSVILQSEFHKLYKGQYLVGFWWDDEPYPPKELSARVRLNNYEFLSDEQKKILDLAVRLANSIRTEDGCKNIPVECLTGSKTENTTESVSQQTEKQRRKARTPHVTIEMAAIECYFYKLLRRNKILEREQKYYLKSNIQKKYKIGASALSKDYGGDLCKAIENHLHDAPKWDDCKYKDTNEFKKELGDFILSVVEDAKRKIALRAIDKQAENCPD